MVGPQPRGASLLDLLEPGWRRHLGAGGLAGTLEVEAAVRDAVARALGDQSRARSPAEVARQWPACLVVGLAQVAGVTCRNGRFWPGWHRAAGLRVTRRSADHWGQAFLEALTVLGITPPGPASEAVLVHAAVPDPGQPEDEPAQSGVLRLEPFGRGVLVADGAWRPAVPHEVPEPLLVFDEGGEHLGPVLPAGPVWVVHPAGLDLCSDVPPRVMVTSRLPLTWRGWRLAQLDLDGVSWLELEIPAARRRHRVRGRLKPRLDAGPPVPGVTTATAAPVHARLPAVLLPAGTWRIEARRAGGGPVLAAVTTTAADWRPDQLWRQVSRPVLGTVTVTVAPADHPVSGAGLRRSVTVAEGLDVAYSPAPRLTSEQGLEPAEAALTTPPGMTVSPQAAFIPAGSVTTRMTCVAGSIVVPLRVRPPHLRMRIEPEPGGKPTAWHHLGPLAIGGSDLRRGGALRLDLPGLGWDPPLEVISREQIVQVLQPTRLGRYPLRRMLDTVNSHREVSLRITVGGRTAIIAHVRGTADRADPWLPGSADPSRADPSRAAPSALEGSAPWT